MTIYCSISHDNVDGKWLCLIITGTKYCIMKKNAALWMCYRLNSLTLNWSITIIITSQFSNHTEAHVSNKYSRFTNIWLHRIKCVEQINKRTSSLTRYVTGIHAAALQNFNNFTTKCWYVLFDFIHIILGDALRFSFTLFHRYVASHQIPHNLLFGVKMNKKIKMMSHWPSILVER